MTVALRDYQRVAVDYLGGRDKAGLFLDMGLGKTASVLTALEPRHLPALVIAPKRVAETVWRTEARKFRPDLKVALAVGEKSARLKALQTSRADVVVISRDNIGDVTDLWEPRGMPWKTVVLDELSSFKSRSSLRWKRARKITIYAPHVWGLTGTPAPNGLIDLWSQIFLLDGGKRLGKTLTGYRDQWFTPGHRLPNGVVTRWDPRPGAEEEIHQRLEDLCLYMGTEGRVDLPERTFNTVHVPLTPATKRLYKTLKDDLVLDMDLLGTQHFAGTAAALSDKLAQITAGFLYQHDEDTGEVCGVDRIHTEKIKALEEIVAGTGSPVLVAYRYTEERDMILEAFPQASTIKEPDVVDRWNAGKVPMLVAHPASIGHGLNLQDGGHTMVWTTASWSLEEWDQTNKRLHRSGQRNPVIIHILVSPGTVDEAVLKALKAKTSVQDALLEHLESPL